MVLDNQAAGFHVSSHPQPTTTNHHSKPPLELVSPPVLVLAFVLAFEHELVLALVLAFVLALVLLVLVLVVVLALSTDACHVCRSLLLSS